MKLLFCRCYIFLIFRKSILKIHLKYHPLKYDPCGERHQEQNKRPETNFRKEIILIVNQVKMFQFSKRKYIGIQSGQQDRKIHDEIEIFYIDQAGA